IVASALDWEQARLTLDHSLDKLPADLRGTRPDGMPHSIWELVEHIRLTQFDLLNYCRNPDYTAPKWPDEYWPAAQAPASDAEWEQALETIRREAKEFADFTTEPGRDLTAKIPHGEDHTYLRTILVSIDHTSYHVGQVLYVRRMLGAWPPA